MKATKITYYLTTVLLSLLMVFSAYSYLTKPELKEGFQHLGFPDYFRIELALAKLLAAIGLWIPNHFIKDTAYIGLSISFISAAIAHAASGDPLSAVIAPLVIFMLLLASFFSRNKLYASN